MSATSCLVVAAAFSAVAGTASAPTDKLNLLMIISDQHRWDALGEAGNQIIRTPVLDKLARDGTHFTNAYTICPVCCPSRTSMLAGRPPEQTGVRGNGNFDIILGHFPAFLTQVHPTPTRAVCDALLGTCAAQVLIGAWNPML